jgi:hypothetical protein
LKLLTSVGQLMIRVNQVPNDDYMALVYRILDRIKSLHQPMEFGTTNGGSYLICKECSGYRIELHTYMAPKKYPCETIKLADSV